MANPNVPSPVAKPSGGSPDPFREPADYLLAKGWRPLGNPEWESCGWLDPTRSLEDTKEEVPVMAPHLERIGTLPDGKPKMGYVVKQIKVQDSMGSGRLTEDATQLRITPKVEPIFLQEALLRQMTRDQKKLTA